MSDRIEIPPMPGMDGQDYSRDLLLAQIARASLSIRDTREPSKPLVAAGLLPEGHTLLVSHVDPAQRQRMEVAGLSVIASQKKEDRTGPITIAFRGIDSIEDLGAVKVLARDGSWGKELIGLVSPFSPRNEAERQVQRLSEFLAGKTMPSWHPQFTAALDYVGEVIRRNPGVEVQVTGVGLGGASAQLAAHTYGLEGRAFEPLGAADLLKSPEYAQWLQHNRITPQGVKAPGDFDYGFVNYYAKRSKVEEYGGESIGRTEHFSPAVGRKGVGEWAAYAGGLADGLLSSPLFEVAGVLTNKLELATAALDLGDKVSKLAYADMTSMDRMVRVFEMARDEGKLPTFGSIDQPAGGVPLLDNPAHPGHALYAQALQGMQANPRFPGGYNQQQLAANLVAAIATLPEGRVSDGLLQEKLSRIDTVTLSSDGTALMAIDGKPDANLRLRYGMPLEQAQSASFEAASQQAYDALSRQRADEQALAAQRDREQPRDPDPPGPVVG